MSGDAIIAIASPPGRGGVGIIRISVPDAQFKAASGLVNVFESVFGVQPKPRYAHHVHLHSEDQSIIDDGLLLYFPAPHSFTGEHVIEFQGHGGPALISLCLRTLLKADPALQMRLARPGEFTQRAFLNGKLDLAQAEAVADVIDAGSERAARAAMASLQGEFSRQVHALAEDILQLRLLVEATLDFPEEEIEFLQQSDALGRLKHCRQQLQILLQQSRKSVRAASGFRIVIAGRPNVGKSSLLNALSGEDRAIVTPIAGTTRDSIHQDLELNGIRLTLIDTAGLRNSDDPVEQIGMQRALKEIETADLLLVLADASLSSLVLPDSLQTLQYGGPQLLVLNKSDLVSSAGMAWSAPADAVLVSAQTGQGLATLQQRIFDVLQCDPHGDLPFLARERHVQALITGQLHLVQADEHAQHADSRLDLFAEELRLAHDALGEITGRVLPDDLLGFIFSRFCIGK